MKIVVLSTSDSGGAGKFSYHLHKSFLKKGLISTLIVKDKTTRDSSVIQASKSFFVTLFYDIMEYLLERYLPERQTDPNYYFYNRVESFTKFPAKYIEKILPYQPDIILVGWVSGFINFKTLYNLKRKSNAKIVFYFTDMGNLTGGCHYDMFCNKYTTDCKNCPAILSRLSATQAHKNLMVKKKYIDLMQPNIFPGTTILSIQTRQSFLYQQVQLFECSNAPINEKVFNQRLVHIAREILRINTDKRVLFIGSTVISEYRKGFKYLLEALSIFNQKYPEHAKNTLLLIAGNYLSPEITEKLSGFELMYLEYVQDDKLLSIVYQSADIFICPSIYDSGPLMVMESLMCGTPVVSFDVGVSTELVINNYTGYKAQNYSSEDLANGIYSVLILPDHEYRQMRTNCIAHTTPLCGEEIIIEKIIKDLRSLIK